MFNARSFIVTPKLTINYDSHGRDAANISNRTLDEH